MAAHFTNALLVAAESSIPKSSGKPHHAPVPWWNKGCAVAIRARKRALTVLRHHPTTENLIRYKQLRSRARRIIRESKKSSWRAYISSLNYHTPSKVVWEKVKKIKGTWSPCTIPGLLINGSINPAPGAIVNSLASYYASISSSDHYSPEFRTVKLQEERKPLHFSSATSEVYNAPFTRDELLDSISSVKSTAPGPDQIHNSMLANLPEAAVRFLLNLFNKIWQENSLPDAWRTAIIIPIPKPGKDRSLPSSYRPISLTSCVCKLMERMVNRRLVWTLEQRNLLTNIQCGFRNNRSTLDHLVSLSTRISTSFVLREHLVAVFFDLNRAYDTTWRYGILRTLYTWGFRGYLPLFVEQFLSHRSFRVRLGNTFSGYHILENGVPQGSILSVTLFAISINSIADNVRAPVGASLFVDDFAIYCSSTSISVVERQIQLVLNRLHSWSTRHGFSFSESKTCCMHFCRKYHVHCDPTLHLGNEKLPFVETAKFLGLTFDRRLTWKPHLHSLRSRCNLSLNVLRVLSGTSWGADRRCLLRLYRTLVRSLLDYGSIVYGSACKTNLRILDTLHNAGVRLSTGAFCTSRIECLLVDAGEPSLSKRRDILLASYGAKLSGLRHHPTHQYLLRPSHIRSYHIRPSLPRPAGVRLQDLLQNLNTTLPAPVEFQHIRLTPWTLRRAVFNFDLAAFLKRETSPSLFKIMFREIQSRHPGYCFLYTDGSLDNNSTACAFYCDATTQSFKLHSFCSVYTAEKYAIYQALKYVESATVKRSVLCSDSLSALQSLATFYTLDALTLQIQELIDRLLKRNFQLILCWIPGHMGIDGNELADQAAKEATLKSTYDIFMVPTADTKQSLRREILKCWQSEWSTKPYKLRQVKEVVTDWKSSTRSSRREEVILTRLRIGHCRLTHGFLLHGDPPPICQRCQLPLTVEHILVVCSIFQHSRERFHLHHSLHNVLGDHDDNLSRLFLFLRSSGLYDLI